MYCAVSGSFHTVLIPSFMTMVESLVQVTVVAGPPVELQVRMNCEVHPSISGNLSIILVIIRLPTIKVSKLHNGWGLELQALTSSVEIESNIHCVSYTSIINYIC